MKLAIALWLQAFVALILPAANASMENDALQDQLKAVEWIADDLRQLSLDTTPSREFHSREEMIEYFALDGVDSSRLGYDPLMQFYLAFDLIDPAVDLYSLTGQMNGENVGGYYDIETQTINLVLVEGDDPGDSLNYYEEIVYVHEYTHALQDANFDVSVLMRNAYRHSEGYVALLSLIEGDAMFMQDLYTNHVLPTHPDAELILGMSLLGENASPGLHIPSILRAELYLPYLDGMNFVKALYTEGGWELVNSAYDNPPISTEHILHPERYLAGDLPLNLDIQPMRGILEGDWTMVNTDTLGEFYLRQYLSTQLDYPTVDTALTGWGGDQYRLFYNKDINQRAWVMLIGWDTSDDQSEFTTAYHQFMQLRTHTDAVSYAEADCWGAEDGVFCIHDAELVILAYAPTLKEAIALIDSQTD